jgi:hypothetical protein
MSKADSFAEWWLLHKDELMQNEQAGLREIAEAAWKEATAQADQKMSVFVELTEQTRIAQSTYFREQTGTSLKVAKKLESNIDQAIANYRQGVPMRDAVQLSLKENGGG